MNHKGQLFLLLIQSVCITWLVILEFNDYAFGMFEMPRWALLAALCVTTGLLIFIRFRVRTRLKQMTVELRRAMSGNLKTRLFAKDDNIWNEVIFSINELLEQLENVQIETIQSEAARKSLLSSISHDIRTPLTSIIGYVTALKDQVAISEQEQREYLEIVSRKSDELKVLIDEIFTMAKLDADEMPQVAESLDFTEMAREALIAFLPELNIYGIELKVQIPDEKCLILADRLSVMRIIGNMIKNAMYYGREGKVLGVELAEVSDEYQLLIWDQGPGISKAELDHVFERMYRTDPSRNVSSGGSGGGSGLGLAIAKALVEKNSGRIWAESIPWHRTVFGIAFKKQLRIK
ncbi:sensor histidine kinase [Paenibacillus eucommiae]|uniref:histidine kinase n=1 Tax=Paenibacillus eucommiae TaxID=1355755 RepID=A0ABS4JAV8_9BACL|nr:HAMP domain-containing sensor histidine kinase [Paenibacillus eucommiae]MBP1996979.1 signal transduction histidine kinase [Paenibacillus eucommiae]